MKINLKGLILGLAMVFMSCDSSYDYTYQLTNDSNSQIRISFTRGENSSLDILAGSYLDTTIILKERETRTLYLLSHGVEGPSGPYFDDVNKDIKNVTVKNSDSLLSKKDYTNNTSWKFVDGLYMSSIRSEEFK